MHRLSTAVPQSSTLTALCFLGLLGVRKSTPAGPDPEAGALAGLVIAAPAALRNENLCITPANSLRSRFRFQIAGFARVPGFKFQVPDLEF
jgi:hypothetical protein